MILALTGATGFVGGHVLEQALAAGHTVRALTRREQLPRDRVTWVQGDLARPGALCEGAAAVVHVAGVVNALTKQGFVAGNVDGTCAMLRAAEEADVRRFVHVSSLAAREPQLSLYGWSKREAEALVEESGLDWTIVRPPAVYGPGDMEIRDVFRAARLGVVPLPPPGRMSVLHAADLARLLLAVAAGGERVTYEPEDASGALTNADFARAIGRAVGRTVLPLPLPGALLSLGARLDGAMRGNGAKLTADRVAYMIHPDWSADPARCVPRALWTPRIDLATGLAETARWYRARGLL